MQSWKKREHTCSCPAASPRYPGGAAGGRAARAHPARGSGLSPGVFPSAPASSGPALRRGLAPPAPGARTLPAARAPGRDTSCARAAGGEGPRRSGLEAARALSGRPSPVLKTSCLSSLLPKSRSMETKRTPHEFWMPKTAPLHHMAASITTQPQPPSGGSGAAALPGQPGLPGASSAGAAGGWALLSPLPGHHSPPFSRRSSSPAGGPGKGVAAAGSAPAPWGSSCSLTGAIPGAGVRPSRRAAPAFLFLLPPLLATSRPPPASAPGRGGCGHPAALALSVVCLSVRLPVCGTERGQRTPPLFPPRRRRFILKGGLPRGRQRQERFPPRRLAAGGEEGGRPAGERQAKPRSSPGPPTSPAALALRCRGWSGAGPRRGGGGRERTVRRLPGEGERGSGGRGWKSAVNGRREGAGGERAPRACTQVRQSGKQAPGPAPGPCPLSTRHGSCAQRCPAPAGPGGKVWNSRPGRLQTTRI